MRWLQRFTNLKRAFRNLEEGLSVTNPSKLEQQGIIKAFELCYELAWKTLQDYLRDLGFQQVVGPKAVIRTAFREGLISDGTSWADLHAARNASTHLYDEETALSLEKDIRANYRHLFTTLVAELDARSPATDTESGSNEADADKDDNVRQGPAANQDPGPA